MNTGLNKYILKKDVSFLEVYYRFKHNNFRNILLVISSDDYLIGVIGVKEITAAAARKDALALTAEDIANKNYTFVYDDDDYRSRVLELFYQNDYNNVPVITKDGRVSDLLNRIDFYELRMMSYAFYSGEDTILAFVLRDIENLFYIDVGAFDPDFASVTKHFYDNGACGINIEPLYNQYKMLLKARPRDININAICSDKDDADIDFYVCYGGGNSTARAEYAFQDAIETKIKSVSLKNVVKEHLSLKQAVHFLKIDVEGFEKQVLEGMDFSRNRPWIVMLEATVPSSNIPTKDLWEHILLENGYVFARQYSVNRFYVDSTLSDILLSRFIDIEKMRHRLVMSDVRLNMSLSYI